MTRSPAFSSTISLGALAVAAILAIDAPAEAAPRECFYSRSLSNWTDAGEGRVYLRVGVSDVYELKLAGSCPDLHFAESIGVETRGGSSNICSGLDVNIIVPSSTTHTVPLRCMGTDLRKLSPEEAKALPAKLRP